jgi:hypothetical protein
MKKVKIGDCKYIYSHSENTYILTYDPSDDWVDELKGEVAYKIVDNGNGLEITEFGLIITQIKKNFLDYGQAAELKYLLSKIK